MRILQLYILRQVLATLVMTVLVFTFVLILGNVLKEVLGLLVNRQVEPQSVLRALGLLSPYVLVYALPMGLLTATLLVFGRFSADRELTAARANGVSLSALAAPVLLMSLLFSGLCAWINFDLAPQSRLAYEKLLFKVGQGTQAEALLPAGRYVKELPGIVLYAGKVQENQLQDVLFYRLKQGQKVLDIRAPEAFVKTKGGTNQITLEFIRPRMIFKPSAFGSASGSAPPTHLKLDAKPSGAKRDPNAPSQISGPDGPENWTWFLPGRFTARLELPTPESFRPPKLKEMTLGQLLQERQRLRNQGIDTTPVLVQIHRQAAFSFASIGFTLIGIPLGIRAHRRETSVGVAIAIALVAVYYGFIILGEALETQAGMFPYVLLWVPNFLFQGIGAILLWRTDHGPG